ncbi:MAG: hypothetical protein MJZ43_00995 [Bacteroidaceae bacterium]|nr:hypothetical protein [Bacteroidaceae bacterium]
MKTNISLRQIAVLLSATVLSPSFVSCSEDEELASFAVPEVSAVAPAEEWDIIGPTEFNKVGPSAASASQMAEINEKYGIDSRMVNHSVSGRRSIVGTIAWEAAGSKIAKTALNEVEKYAKSYAKKKVTQLVKNLLGIKDKPDPAMEMLKEISAQLGGINNKLDTMTVLLTNLDDKSDDIYTFLCSQDYRKFNEQRMNLAKLSEVYIDKISVAAQQYGEADSLQAEAHLASILNEWAHTTINGNPAYIDAYNYAKRMCEYKIRSVSGTGMNLCTLYDKIVYDSFPWENLGYESREQFRALQAVETVQALELAYLYWSTQGTAYGESQMNEIQNAMQNVANLFAANEVVRHPDKAICQIKGSHFEMNLSDGIQHHPDITWKNGEPFSINDASFPFLSGACSGNFSDSALKDAQAHSLTPEDANNMKAYFDNYLSKETSCPRDWFSLAGFDMSKYPYLFDSIVMSNSTAVFRMFIYGWGWDGGYYPGKPSSYYNLSKCHVDFVINNLLYINSYGYGSGSAVMYACSDVSRSKEYQTNYEGIGKIPAWHSCKINQDRVSFSENIISLRLTRLD